MPINKPSSKKPVILILEYGDQTKKKEENNQNLKTQIEEAELKLKNYQKYLEKRQDLQMKN